jgi:hypothetical protein
MKNSQTTDNLLLGDFGSVETLTDLSFILVYSNIQSRSEGSTRRCGDTDWDREYSPNL